MNITTKEGITNFKYKQEHQRAFKNLFYQWLSGNVAPKVNLDALLEGQKGDTSLYALACRNLINTYRKLNK
jgi:hypothetical protein